jgi:hypothetical protein
MICSRDAFGQGDQTTADLRFAGYCDTWAGRYAGPAASSITIGALRPLRE